MIRGEIFLDDFKKWMVGQKYEPQRRSRHADLVDQTVESKISVKKLLGKMAVDEGDAEELAEDFRKNGGLVKDADADDNLLISVDSGTFTLPGFFVRKASQE